MPPHPQPPIDPDAGPTFALAGRVVTMDDSFHVLPHGVVYVANARIAGVSAAGDPPPAGFEHVEPLATRGTIYPGLIELHNHLSYNALRLWDVPKLYTNRDQWAQGDVYRGLITGPMKVLAHTVRYVWAIVRYVECKSLLGGTTTSQGIALSSYAGIMRFYRGIVRNVEQTNDPNLPEAATRIPDVAADNRDSFLKRLGQFRCLVLHLSEGVDDAARKHFLALQEPDGSWAMRDSLTGIHCVALQPADFEVLAAHGAGMVWSPLSNLLLYGRTADIKAAKASGIRIGLGPDWSPSGSKNLLGELKIARLASAAAGGVFTDRELVLAATRGAAEILRWDAQVGSLTAGRLADLVVLRGQTGDPYAHLLEASDADVELVVIDGTPRYGASGWMKRLLGPDADACEPVTIAGRERSINLHEPTADPEVATLTLAQAADLLTDGLKRLPELATGLEARIMGMAQAAPDDVFLVLDHDEIPDESLRPNLPDADGKPTGMLSPLLAAQATPLEDLLKPLELDALTVATDPDFVERLGAGRNLPAPIAAGIRATVR